MGKRGTGGMSCKSLKVEGGKWHSWRSGVVGKLCARLIVLKGSVKVQCIDCVACGDIT